MPEEKLTSLAEAIGMVPDGATVAIQNMATQSAPMAAVRELIRQGRTGLEVVALVGGIPIDLMAAAGTMDRFTGAAVSMEQFGLCQAYRRAVESGQIVVQELSETALNARLGAGARNLPFLPTRGLIGTDLIAINPDLVMVSDPFGGLDVVACRALVPDFALVHCHRADRFGNLQMEPTAVWPDIGIMPKAAKNVIATVEEIVDTEVLRSSPERTFLPGFMVDAVVEVPFGAHPTSFNPRYGYDTAFHREWIAVARDPDGANAWMQRYVHEPATQEDYLDRVGGPSRLEELIRWEITE
jgi:glutaconate CoA-transferase subunit A